MLCLRNNIYMNISEERLINILNGVANWEELTIKLAWPPTTNHLQRPQFLNSYVVLKIFLTLSLSLNWLHTDFLIDLIIESPILKIKVVNIYIHTFRLIKLIFLRNVIIYLSIPSIKRVYILIL